MEQDIRYLEIEGHPGYFVGEDGSIWSTKFGKQKKLKFVTNKDGYYNVSFCKDDPVKTERVHLLVLKAFVGPKPVGCVGCHNNSDKTDNRPENLRWDTPENNHLDKVRRGTDNGGERSCYAKLTAKQVEEVKARYKNGETQTGIAKSLGVYQTTIRDIVIGKTWKYP